METALVDKSMETQVVDEKGQEEEKENNAGKGTDKSDDPRWYESLVEDYDYERPKRGQVVKGEIIWIEEDSILMDIGQKRDAVVPGKDLSDVDDEYLATLSVGDRVPVYVTQTPVGDEELMVSLNRGIEYQNWEKAEQLHKDNTMVELEVVDQNRGGLLVKYKNLTGFVPNSHIPSIRRGLDRQKIGQIKREMIGSTLAVKPIEVNPNKRRLVFSARAAQEEKRKKRLRELEEGDVIESNIVNVVDFGVFVDLDGVDGLVHKSELDWERINNPHKHFKVSEEITVKVLDVEVDRERVSLSRKALLPNPWEVLEEKYKPGDLVKGEVVSVLDFGAFVELPEGVQGLIHSSEIGYSGMGSPQNTVKPGESVLVRIISIDADRERISLSMRRVPIEDQLSWMMDSEAEEEKASEDIEDITEEEEAPVEVTEESLTEVPEDGDEPTAEEILDGETDSDVKAIPEESEETSDSSLEALEQTDDEESKSEADSIDDTHDEEIEREEEAIEASEETPSETRAEITEEPEEPEEPEETAEENNQQDEETLEREEGGETEE